MTARRLMPSHNRNQAMNQSFDSDNEFIGLAYQEGDSVREPIRVGMPVAKTRKKHKNVPQASPIAYDFAPPPLMPSAMGAHPPGLASSYCQPVMGMDMNPPFDNEEQPDTGRAHMQKP